VDVKTLEDQERKHFAQQHTWWYRLAVRLGARLAVLKAKVRAMLCLSGLM